MCDSNGVKAGGRAKFVRRGLALAVCLVLGLAQGCANRQTVLESFESLDGWTVWPKAWGGKAAFEKAPDAGVGSGAIQVTMPGVVYKELSPDQIASAGGWNKCTGLSFMVKGNGSDLYACLAIGPAGAGSWRHGFASKRNTGYVVYFPLKDEQWHEVRAAWRDFAAEGEHPGIGTDGGMSPAAIRVIRLGSRWKYYRNYARFPQHQYAVDQIRFLTEALPQQRAKPLRPFAEVMARLRAREPVRVLCLGDSITAGAGVKGPQTYWSVAQGKLREHFGYDQIAVEGWGIGGATVLDACPWARWHLSPPPDLVTVMFGTNDSSAYPPAFFVAAFNDYLARIARATRGKTAVLLISTPLGLGNYYTKTDPYAQAVRQVAEAHHLPCLDLHQALKQIEQEELKTCFGDGVHPNATGHELIAEKLAAFLIDAAASSAGED